MTPLTEIFEHIRKGRGMLKNQLAEHLGVTIGALNAALERRIVPYDWIVPWANFLEIAPSQERDYQSLIQYHGRQQLYASLPPSIPDNVRRLVTDIMFFNTKLDIDSISNNVLKCVISEIEMPLHEVSNAIMDLKKS